MRKTYIYFALAAVTMTVASCAVGSRSQAGGEVTGVSAGTWTEPTPYGMVLVSRGSLEMGPREDDSLWHIKANPKGMSVDAFWNKYQNERMVELAFEGHRFYDLRRWKDGDKLKSITEMKLTKNEDGTITYKRSVVHRVWDDKMYFFPIPQSERMKNPNLSQNTGW